MRWDGLKEYIKILVCSQKWTAVKNGERKSKKQMAKQNSPLWVDVLHNANHGKHSPDLILSLSYFMLALQY